MYPQRTTLLLANVRWQVALSANLHRGIHLLKKLLCRYPQHAPEIAAEIGFAHIAQPHHLP